MEEVASSRYIILSDGLKRKIHTALATKIATSSPSLKKEDKQANKN